MMDRQDEIVEEVLRRVKLYLGMKKVLLVLRDDSDFLEVKYLAEILEGKGNTILILSLLSKDIKVLEWPVFKDKESIRAGVFKEKSYRDFMSGFQGMLISDLGCEESRNYMELRFRETLGKLIFETIKEDKPVYALSGEMTGVKNEHLEKRMKDMKEELGKMKIHLLTEKVSRRINMKEEPEEKNEKKEKKMKAKERRGHRVPLEGMENPVLDHKFITLADVLSQRGQEEIRISGSARLTMEASDYLDRQGIRVERLQNRN
ncbi:MAG TPA: hypothetical protein VLM88_12935 [Proteiniclasticum sp.]|nr:hypothetical protein [Proteiniclasticum sp.]